MDLLSLVASLTLDASEYTSGLQAAEKEAENFNPDLDKGVTLDTNDFDSGLADASENANSFNSTFSGIIGSLAGALTAAGIVAAIKNISKAFQEAVNDAAAYADQVDKGSKALSMSTETYQLWQHVLGQTGASMSTISRGWINLNDAMYTSKNMAEEWAAYTGDVKKGLDGLGIDPRDFQTVDDLFASIVDSLAKMPEGNERDTLAQYIFGRNAKELNAMFDEGVEGIEKLKQEAYDLKLIMSGEDVENGVALGDAIENMNAAVSALKQEVLSGIIPVLTQAVQMVTSIVAFFNGRSYDNDPVSQITENMQNSIDEAYADSYKAQGIVGYMKDLVDQFGEAATKTEQWKTALSELKGLLPEIGAEIEESITNGKIEEYIQQVKEAAIVQAQQEAIKAYERAYAESLATQASAEADVGIYTHAAEAARQSLIEQINKFWEELKFETPIEDMYGDLNGLSAERLGGIARDLLTEWAGKNPLGMGEEDLTAKFVELQSQIDTAVESYNENSEAAKQAAENAKKFGEQASAAAQRLSYVQSALSALGSAASGLASRMSSLQLPSFSGGSGAGGAGGGHERSGGGGNENYVAHAKGLNYVPWDNYIASLHRGELVLNQAQARDYRSGNGGMDANLIASLVAEAVAGAVGNIQINMNGRAVGNAVSGQVSRNIYHDQLGRRLVL